MSDKSLFNVIQQGIRKYWVIISITVQQSNFLSNKFDKKKDQNSINFRKCSKNEKKKINIF